MLTVKMGCKKVLNLIITGIPSILIDKDGAVIKDYVLNLIITGIPSILGMRIKLVRML